MWSVPKASLTKIPRLGASRCPHFSIHQNPLCLHLAAAGGRNPDSVRPAVCLGACGSAFLLKTEPGSRFAKKETAALCWALRAGLPQRRTEVTAVLQPGHLWSRRLRGPWAQDRAHIDPLSHLLSFCSECKIHNFLSKSVPKVFTPTLRIEPNTFQRFS